MLSRRRIALGAMFALVLGLLATAVPSASAATPIALVLPQANAFSILGHSCGGIQEAAYATGFGTIGGYPVGDVYMSTRCGGSGRGGGYHTTTYAAWASVTWDFTGAVVSDAALSGAPTVNATFSATDQFGNTVYNQSNSAFLLLAAGVVPAPRVTSISVTSGPASGGTSVVITGTGFTGATGVHFGTSAATRITVNSATSIAAVSPSAPAGTVDVTVTSAGGTSPTSGADQFTFVGAPTVSGISPNRGTVLGGSTVTITGTHLLGATAVRFGGTPAGFWVDGDTSITAYAPPGEQPERVDVTVTSIGGTSARSTADQFTYTPVPAPAVTGVSPSSGLDVGGDTVTITGSGFTNAYEVDFGGVAAPFTVNDDTTITAYTPGGTDGTVDVTVISAGGTSATNAADQYTYLAVPAPAGHRREPEHGPGCGRRHRDDHGLRVHQRVRSRLRRRRRPVHRQRRHDDHRLHAGRHRRHRRRHRHLRRRHERDERRRSIHLRAVVAGQTRGGTRRAE